MTTRSQKRKAVAELVSGDFEASLTENNSTGNLIASSSKNPRLEPENLEELKTTLRKEIKSDLTKILAENQKEMLKLIAPVSKKRPISSNIQDSDSDQENISATRTSTPVKTQTATNSKTTPMNSRNTKVGTFWLVKNNFSQLKTSKDPVGGSKSGLLDKPCDYRNCKNICYDYLPG